MDFRRIIEMWPTIALFADDVGVGYEAARKMLARNTISEVHWQAVIDAARERGYRLDVTQPDGTVRRESIKLAHLMEAAAKRRRRRSK